MRHSLRAKQSRCSYMNEDCFVATFHAMTSLELLISFTAFLFEASFPNGTVTSMIEKNLCISQEWRSVVL
jgi:hypothetical protein